MKDQLLILLIIIFSLNLTAQEPEHKPIKKQKKEVITNDNPFLNPKSYQTSLDINYNTVDYGQDITNDDYLDKDFDWNNAYAVKEHRTHNQPSFLLAIILFIILILGIIVFYRRRNSSEPKFNLLTENMKKKSNNIFSWVIIIIVILVFWV